MTKKKLEKEAGNWLRKYLLCCNCEKKCNCIDSNSYCEEQVLKAYVDSAESREKRIADLEKENVELRAKLKTENCLKLLAKEGYVKFTNEQLLKTKELLSEFIRISKASDEDFEHDYSELIEETEQFLVEVTE